MKVAYVVSLFPKVSETFILRELVELDRRGYDLVILSLKKDREPIEHREAGRFVPKTLYPSGGLSLAGSFLGELLRHPMAVTATIARVVTAHLSEPAVLVKSLATLVVSLGFARRVRALGIRHIHAHWASYPALAAWALSKLVKVPYSVTGHAHDLFLPNPMLPVKIRESSFFATISEFNRALLIQTCGPESLRKIRLIRCGLPLEQFRFGEHRPSKGAPARVISVGRLVDYKGFDVLIRACGILRDRGCELRCRIAGEGPERQALEGLVRSLGLEDVVALEGARRQDEVVRLLEEADLFVLACVTGHDGQQDGIPIVLMESMAIGVPVVSTKLSGIPELVMDNKTGLLATPGDPWHLAAAMERMLADPELVSRLVQGARRRVESEFDIRNSVSMLCDEFERSALPEKGA